MAATFTITMHGQSGDHDFSVDEVPGWPGLKVDCWDNAIHAAWNALGPTGNGWRAATIAGPYGRVVHLDATDKEADIRAMVDRANAKFPGDGFETPLFDDEN